AIEPLQRALAIEDDLTEAHYLLGLCLRAEGRLKEALAAFNRTVAIEPAFTPAREELAQLHAALGRNRDAIEQLEALAALDPARPERLVTLGLTYARLGQPEAAILTLGRAAERYPDSPLVYTALGRVWLDLAEAHRDAIALDKALEALAVVAERPDAASEALTLYGRALLRAGRVTAAERTLQRATTRFPVERAAFRHLADAAGRLGHRTLAEEAAARYAALGSS
ncbi:MAG TPA: tetratricopeptide repeat protein, partial [Vicinamibacterales bacterium]|nr:tetratricopeptide repeat protein [Vicinamibacterales bacterium]